MKHAISPSLESALSHTVQQFKFKVSSETQDRLLTVNPYQVKNQIMCYLDATSQSKRPVAKGGNGVIEKRHGPTEDVNPERPMLSTVDPCLAAGTCGFMR